MSILIVNKDNPEDVTQLGLTTKKVNNNEIVTDQVSLYQPSEGAKLRRQEIIKDFTLGYVTMYKPRREFNDLSLVSRLTVDKMSFLTFQPNDGDALDGDIVNSWKSRAMKPIIRNKIMSIAAHATARLLFPKIFAYNENDDEEEDAAIVLESLQEWAADRSNYAKTSLYAVITSLWSPAAIIYTDYTETYRTVKRNGEKELMLDENLSGFQDEVVPVDELYIENFYEPDIQRQGWLIRRRVQSYTLSRAKYENKYEDFKFVRPGIQLVYNDANQLFYEVYDTNMRQEMVEEITYWRKSDDVKIVMVNGVMLTDPDNENPRNDKMYPFDKFGYSILDEGRCFYYKSLAFHMTPETKIINTLYPMIVDGTYLSIMPPMINVGADVISQDVIIPGATTNLTDPNANLTPLSIGQNNQGIRTGMETLQKVEESINEATSTPLESGDQQPGTTAYEISVLEKNAATVLGLFVKMISEHVRSFGKLRLGDILQYLTIGEVKMIAGKEDGELVYKTFYLYNKGEAAKTRKIKFDSTLPNQMTQDQKMSESFKVLEEQGGLDSKTLLYKVNPELIRNLKYMVTVNADILNPMSEELERAYALEEYDRMVLNPNIDPEETARFLLQSYPKTKKEPDKYIVKQPPQGTPNQQVQPNQNGLPQQPVRKPAVAGMQQ